LIGIIGTTFFAMEKISIFMLFLRQESAPRSRGGKMAETKEVRDENNIAAEQKSGSQGSLEKVLKFYEVATLFSIRTRA
jgi:hypothetical protein